ncbi:hypothetical protein OUZ56_012346 [Daphnia magna]|uniref:Uncharacterized protein n=1 Tax=Daphnia magna TaxID=35525 RepID=A0ABQ9Z2R4_9CRUS|nr:hypothetical protein OUZ56_012346 [Daphnia magna]
MPCVTFQPPHESTFLRELVAYAFCFSAHANVSVPKPRGSIKPTSSSPPKRGPFLGIGGAFACCSLCFPLKCLLTEGNKRLGKLSVYAYVLPGIPPLPIAAPIRASGPDIFISTARNETLTWIPAPVTSVVTDQLLQYEG